MKICWYCGKTYAGSGYKYCPTCGRLRTKFWRMHHLTAWRMLRNETKARHNDETLQYASMQNQRWSTDELNYVKLHGQIKTIREMALDLCRSYHAVQMMAYHYGISLANKDKTHGRIRTK